MTLDEARMILNVRSQDNMDIIAQVKSSLSFSSILLPAVVQYLWSLKSSIQLSDMAASLHRSAAVEALLLTSTPFRDSTTS